MKSCVARDYLPVQLAHDFVQTRTARDYARCAGAKQRCSLASRARAKRPSRIITRESALAREESHFRVVAHAHACFRHVSGMPAASVARKLRGARTLHASPTRCVACGSAAPSWPQSGGLSGLPRLGLRSLRGASPLGAAARLTT